MAKPEPTPTPTRITLPLFPLPDVVLFPGVRLPLHVFEPRYRQLTEDALRADRRLGMALLKPGWEADYLGSPPIHPLVGTGVIESAGRLPDGRFILLVRGEGKGVVTEELEQHPYRRAVLEMQPRERPTPELGPLAAELRAMMTELEGLGVGEPARGSERASEGGVETDPLVLVNTAAHAAPLSPEEKLALLALGDPEARARRAIALVAGVLATRRILERHRRGGHLDVRRN